MEFTEKHLISIAHALYSTRLHVLTLTEVVRLKIEPDEDGSMLLSAEIELELREQAFDYLLAMFPTDVHPTLLEQQAKWTTPQ